MFWKHKCSPGHFALGARGKLIPQIIEVHTDSESKVSEEYGGTCGAPWVVPSGENKRWWR